ncbi:Elongation of very long chain fatty acids protein 7 [Homalodisca vitripennis]|nr:Elongation of very long chain fatty acids protein 7 [Homalodisca vitripennis]
MSCIENVPGPLAQKGRLPSSFKMLSQGEPLGHDELPFPTLGICLFYAYFSKVLGPRLMENRKPFDLRRVLIFYNLIQTVFSSWIFYEEYTVPLEGKEDDAASKPWPTTACKGNNKWLRIAGERFMATALWSAAVTERSQMTMTMEESAPGDAIVNIVLGVETSFKFS